MSDLPTVEEIANVRAMLGTGFGARERHAILNAAEAYLTLRKEVEARCAGWESEQWANDEGLNESAVNMVEFVCADIRALLASLPPRKDTDA